MARAFRQVPNVYLGRPGALVTLPWPVGEIGRDYTRLLYDFISGTGQHVVQTYPMGARTKVVNWNALHVDNFNLLAQYWEGGMGSGPWAFIDPSVNNLLLPNQASATNTLYDTTGWKTANNLASEGSLFSNSDATFIHRTGATRSLRWQFPITLSVRPTLVPVIPYRNWLGIPVVAGLPYTYSLWVRADGIIDSAIGTRIRIRWTDGAGATVGTDADSPVAPAYTTVTGTWQKFTCTGTAPAGAFWGTPGLVVDDTTITLGGSLYVDEPLFEQDSVANAWAPGAGLRAVEILSLTDTAPFETRMRRAATMTLQELVE